MERTFLDYTITDKGEVFHGKRPITGQPNSKGYLRVVIHSKKYFVHRLVAQLFIPNPDNKPQVNHIDGNKLNNAVTNLEWVTNKENREHAVRNNLHAKGESCTYSKLTQEDVDYIRSRMTFRYNKGVAKELAERFNVTPEHINKIVRRDCWKV